MRRASLILLLSIFGLIVVACCGCNNHPQPITNVPEMDTVEQNYEEYLPTVYDILQEREEMRYMRMIDSVYLKIPEQILTHMLVTKGTTISTLEIVEDYIANKQFYHDTILKAMNTQKHYLPDSVPKKALIDKPYESLNLTDSTLLN